MNYKPLPTPYNKNGFEHTLLFREGDIAIFHKVHLAPQFDAGFETVVISRHDGYEMAGTTIEPAECYPSPEMWGTRGWTFQHLLAARKKFNSLLKGDIPEVDGAIATPEMDGDSVNDIRPTPPPLTNIKNLLIPSGEFNTKQLAAHNNVGYSDAYLFIKANLNTKIRFLRQDSTHVGKGKKPSIYTAV
jgi:hypothetical protein